MPEQSPLPAVPPVRARTRTAMGVLAWTAPVALLLFLPQVSDISQGEARLPPLQKRTVPEPAMTMVARPAGLPEPPTHPDLPLRAGLAHSHSLPRCRPPIHSRHPRSRRRLHALRLQDRGRLVQGSGSLEMIRTTDAAGRCQRPVDDLDRKWPESPPPHPRRGHRQEGPLRAGLSGATAGAQGRAEGSRPSRIRDPGHRPKRRAHHAARGRIPASSRFPLPRP